MTIPVRNQSSTPLSVTIQPEEHTFELPPGKRCVIKFAVDTWDPLFRIEPWDDGLIIHGAIGKEVFMGGELMWTIGMEPGG